jgi:hypothetical protein
MLQQAGSILPDNKIEQKMTLEMAVAQLSLQRQHQR